MTDKNTDAPRGRSNTRIPPEENVFVLHNHMTSPRSSQHSATHCTRGRAIAGGSSKSQAHRGRTLQRSSRRRSRSSSYPRSRSPSQDRPRYRERENRNIAYACVDEHCDLVFNDEPQFHQHVLINHYTCCFCDVQFSSTILQLGHSILHLGAESLHCFSCQTNCEDETIARRHQQIHNRRVSARLRNYNTCALCRSGVKSDRMALQNAIVGEFLSFAGARRQANRHPTPIINTATNRGISTDAFCERQKLPCRAKITDVTDNEPSGNFDDAVGMTLADEMISGPQTSAGAARPSTIAAACSSQNDVDFVKALEMLTITATSPPPEDEARDALARLEIRD